MWRSLCGRIRRSQLGSGHHEAHWALSGATSCSPLRQGGGAGTALGFFLTVIVLLPLGLGPDQALLQRIAPGALWIALLLSVLLSADRIFQADYEDGSLDAMALGRRAARTRGAGQGRGALADDGACRSPSRRRCSAF